MTTEISMREVAAELQRIGEATSGKQGEMSARLLHLEQRAALRGSGSAAPEAGVTFGSRVAAAFDETAAKQRLRQNGRLMLEVQSSISTTQSGGSHGSRDVPNAPAASSSSLVSLLQPGDLAGLSVLHYARRTGAVGGAGVQDAEGAVKAAAEPVFAAQSQNCITISGVATLSEQALGSAGGLERAVNSHLARSIRDAVDAVLISGTAAAGWPFAGFASLALPFASAAGYVSIIDAVLSGAVRMKTRGFAPSIAVLPEAMFLQSLLSKGDDGHYLNASSMLAAAGITLALSPNVGAGKSLLIDPAFCGFLSSGSTRISISTIDDQFVRNMITMRGETELIPFFSDYEGAMICTPSAT